MTRALHAYGITAYSWCNALGSRTHRDPTDRTELLAQSGLKPACDLPFATYWGRYPGELPALPERVAHHRSRTSQLLWASIRGIEADLRHAVERWGPLRVGVVIGSSTGGVDVTEQVIAREHRGEPGIEGYDFDAVHPLGALLTMTQKALGLGGPGYVVSTACSSSGKALAAAQRLLEANLCDAVVTGGADALCQLTLQGFACLGILSQKPCRPFDRDRDGISIGEGSALFLLERETSTSLYLLAAGESNDAHHTTAPHPEGLGARLALERTLSLAALAPRDVNYVNAHGTGTRQNDSAEALALAAVLGTGTLYSSTKDRTGHQLGAAGATEAAFCLDALLTGTIPGNRHSTTPDPKLAVSPLPAGREMALSTTLSSSFAFGGSNVVVALGRRDRGHESIVSSPSELSLTARIFVESVAFWAPGLADPNAFLDDAPRGDASVPPARLLPPRPRGRASLLTRLFAELLEQVTGKLSREEGPPALETLPLIFGSALGEMTTTLALLDQLGRGETPSPAGFQSSVHNTSAGVLSIALHNRAFSTTLSAGAETFAMSLAEAMAWLRVHGGRVAVLVADEAAPDRLIRTEASYPAAGVGLLLCLASKPPPGALGSLHDFEQHASAHPDHETYESELRARLSGKLRGLDRAPAGHGVALIQALLARKPGRYAVGNEWTLRVEPAPAN